MTKFIIHSEYGELLDLAMQLQNEGHEVCMYIPDKQSKKIGDGIIPKIDNWHNELGKGYIWLIDGCSHGNLQDWLRKQGEFVFGGSEMGDKLENDRQLGQKLFKSAGFYQPESKNFTDIDDAIQFVLENKERRWILKQNGDAPKSINHMGKFDGNIDMIFHLQTLKKRWNETMYGKFDCDLMEIVEGLEVACSAFFNGKEFMKNKEGKVVGFLNFEEKKECDGGTGETTGEMGTTFIGTTEDNKLFKDIIMRPKIIAVLRKINFRGVFDINCIKTKDGIVALEPTSRFGIPSTSYEFMEGLKMNTGKLLEAVAKGEDTPLEIKEGVGMVMCVVAKPYPVEVDVDDEATSQGEKLWILNDGKPIKDFTDEQKKHIHLANFYKDEGSYFVSTKNGYLLTVTAKGKTIEGTREDLIKYIKDNIYLSGMKYRSDIGKRVEKLLDKKSMV
jgi:phosphoribosylamine--glycine ligase